MRILLSLVILLFTGFINISSVAAYTGGESISIAEIDYQGLQHIDKNAPGSFPRYSIAEFEIEESDSTSKDKHLSSTIPFFGLPAAVIKHFYVYKYNYLDAEAIIPACSSVKSYLLFQVFRL